MMATVLAPRWTPLRHIPIQQAAWHSPHRFNTVPAGRRSGKTEIIGKRRIVRRALRGTRFPDPRFFVGAPTRDQAKRIFWKDMKALIPFPFVTDISETELRISLINGAEIWVVGLDKPERIEGSPWDGGVLDEFANMKPETWTEHVRPALSDRLGFCDFIGVPEGRNHYYELDRTAKAEQAEREGNSEWGSFHWISAEVLPPSEIEAARRDLDELTYQQEYEASFVNFEGRAYYPFEEKLHCAKLRDRYRERAPLIFCFDFNVDPGCAAVGQEMRLPNGSDGTGFIGEVWIERNSNTPAVCRKLVADWGRHAGPVFVYGDATGGARGSAKIEGSDWELVRKVLRSGFGNRVNYKVRSSNPAERARINAVNTRLKAGDGTIRAMVDPKACPHIVRDLEGTRLLKGGSGEIDKKADPQLSHISDAIGYYIEREFPVRSRKSKRVKVVVG